LSFKEVFVRNFKGIFDERFGDVGEVLGIFLGNYNFCCDL
jgi:hypothetical protein